MNKIIIIFVIILLIFGGVIFYQLATHPAPKSKVTINTHTFSVKTATSSAERQQGLSGVKSMPQDQGMLFIFDASEKYPFWMKDMKFALDIIYIRDDKIVQIFQNVPTPKENKAPLRIYQPTVPADRVLEINAELSKKYNFKKNDKVKIVIAK